MKTSTDTSYISMASQVPLGIHHDTEDASVSTENNAPAAKLFVGSLSAAESSGFIQENQISHIITVAASLLVNIPTNCNVQHLIVHCHDHPMASILKVLPECLNFIKTAFNAGGHILVHCASGVSRSVAVCAAFLMIEYDMDMGDALGCIQSVRRYANPNLGFRRQLEVLDRCKGDIVAAQAAYSKETSNVVEDTIRQRRVVNELHVKVDDLEATIATMKSRGETSFECVENALVLLQSEVDSCLPVVGEGLIDPPAKMIRKSAVSKIERLLDSLREQV